MKREAVPPSNERDKWLKRLMPQGTTAAGPCLDAETFAAWADGALSAKALAAAEQHVSECSRCLALVAAMQRTMPEPVQSAHDRRALWRWIVPLTAAATAVAIWIAVPRQQPVQEKAQATTALQERESVTPSTPPTVAAAPESPREELQAQASAAKEPPSVRRDAEESRLRRQNADLKREEKLAAAPDELQKRAAAAVEQSPAAAPSPVAPATPSAPSAAAASRQAEVDTFADNRAVAQRSLDKPNIIETWTAGRRVRWRVIDGTNVERTTDGGQTWIKTSSPPSRVVGIRDVDELHATITTADKRTFTTTDGGATWVLQEKPAAPF